MMRHVARRMVVLSSLPALLAACGTSPPPLLYTLAPVPGAPAPGGPPFVMLHQVAVARYLERPDIVRSSENYRLEVLSNEQWGEPLAQMIGRVLAENLTQRLPGSTVFNSTGAISGPEDAAVEVNVQRMDRDAAGALAFTAQAAVIFTDPHRGKPTRSLRTTVPIAAGGTDQEVRSMSIAIGQFADLIAEMLRQPGAPARQP